uniref:Alternative protein LAMA3 n=1 Tax=Homo sapiens TaxID=9606 RepID=L8E6V6_HUMAN|nr:alternative protein LAMA3 [Homo sapiens]
MSWCAVLWMPPPPTRTSSMPSKRPRTQPTGLPVHLNLPSRQ